MSSVKFELPADNLERVNEFYKSVFGWSSLNLPPENSIINTEGGDVDPNNSSGVFSRRNEFVKAPVLIITVNSIEDTIQKIRNAGGEVLTQKEKVGDFGYSAYIKDTEGNVLCIWEDIK
jgi:predicted enzyme related to lactoylglutathione lyase